MSAPHVSPAGAAAPGAPNAPDGRPHSGCAPVGAPLTASAAAPVIGYVLLWFPLSSETFIFREVVQLRERGLDIRVYTMYGAALRGCSREMREYPGPVTRMGVAAFFRIFGAFFRALGKSPRLVGR
ncbi:MAG: hypothetical protein K2N07_10775, partial [Desulfovibrio sp.]|nr:hypothetical protein [Desulfovibrio sp.]